MSIPSNNPMSGLLVEDVRAMRTYLRTMLQDQHIQIVEAASLKEARDYLRTPAGKSLEFVLLDLELPDGNGLDLMPDIPLSARVIALTAEVNSEVGLQCRKAGCDRVIEKNQELSSLRELISGRADDGPATRYPSSTSSSSYINFLAEMLVDLDDAQVKEDFLAVRRIAHRLRGTAIHFGYPGIGSAAKSVSSALSTGQLQQFDTATNSLRSRISEALEARHLNKETLAITEAIQCEY